MKRKTKWIIGVSSVLAVIIAAVAFQIMVLVAVIGSQQAFYDNGWTLTDDEYYKEETNSLDNNDTCPIDSCGTEH